MPKDSANLIQERTVPERLFTPRVKSAKITSAQVLDLAANPIHLLPWSASDATIIPYHCHLFKPAGTAYVAGTATAIEIRTNAAAGSSVWWSLSIADIMAKSTIAGFFGRAPGTASAGTGLTFGDSANTGIYFGLGAGTDMTTGNSPLYLAVWYVVMPLRPAFSGID